MDDVQRAIQALEDLQVAAPEKAKPLALRTFEAIIAHEEAAEARRMDEVEHVIQALKDLEVVAPEKAKAIALQTFKAIVEQEEVLRVIQALKDLEVAAPERAKVVALRTFEAIEEQEETAKERRMDEEDRHLLEAINASLEEKNIVPLNDLWEITLQTFENIKEQEENEWEDVPTKKKRVFATPEKLLEQGDKHYHEESIDLGQYAHKMWLSVIWSLKKCFLAHKILLSSHKSYDVFVDWLIKKAVMAGNEEELLGLKNGWHKAQDFYHVACCQGGLDPWFVDEWRKPIGKFVELLSRIRIDDGDLAEVIGELKKNAPDTGKVVVEDVPKTPFKFCGEWFNYEHKCF